MTPKEKAEEIYCKYADTLNIRDLQTTTNPYVKRCALIAVDEIINTDMLIDESTYLETKSYLHYWQQVKTEIENL